jgi:hypothetical protein
MKCGVSESLAEVAALVRSGEPFHIVLAEFLDGFYHQPTPEALQAEPPFLKTEFGSEGAIYDAYLAAAAEKLARDFGLPFPDWAENPERALRRPWFASNLPSLRAILIHESPAEFRCRNLFISANGLTRV